MGPQEQGAKNAPQWHAGKATGSLRQVVFMQEAQQLQQGLDFTVLHLHQDLCLELMNATQHCSRVFSEM